MYKWYRFFRFISRKTATQNNGSFQKRILKIRGTPHQIALGLAMGVFISVSPTFGIQIVMAFLLASLLKWNRIAAIVGVFLTNPLTAPFLYAVTYMTGLYFWPYQAPPYPENIISLAFFIDLLQHAPALLIILFIGGVIIGLPLAILAYFLTLKFVQRYRNRVKSPETTISNSKCLE